MAEEDYVNVEQREGDLREVVLVPEDIHMINDNPAGLTKEGCAAKVWIWFQSTNAHCKIRYLAMYRMCKKFKKSESFGDGNVLLARRATTTKTGITKEHEWKERIGMRNANGDIIIAKDTETLHKWVTSQLKNLKFIVNKGTPRIG